MLVRLAVVSRSLARSTDKTAACGQCWKKFKSAVCSQSYINAVRNATYKNVSDIEQLFREAFYTCFKVSRTNENTQDIEVVAVQDVICVVCEAKFIKLKALQRHITQYHYEEVECDGCSKKFRAVRDLQAHFNAVHNCAITDSKLAVLEEEQCHTAITQRKEVSSSEVWNLERIVEKKLVESIRNSEGIRSIVFESLQGVSSFFGHHERHDVNQPSGVVGIHEGWSPLAVKEVTKKTKKEEKKEEKNIECEVCAKKFKAALDLQFHFEAVHKGVLTDDKRAVVELPTRLARAPPVRFVPSFVEDGGHRPIEYSGVTVDSEIEETRALSVNNSQRNSMIFWELEDVVTFLEDEYNERHQQLLKADVNQPLEVVDVHKKWSPPAAKTKKTKKEKKTKEVVCGVCQKKFKTVPSMRSHFSAVHQS